MRKTIRLKRNLKSFRLLFRIKNLLDVLRKEGFSLKVFSKEGEFFGYIDYVLENKSDLKSEAEYVKNNLLKGDSWGEILVIRKKGKIVASFGPNRLERDKNGEIRARVGYFTVLPKFRKKKIGTVLWWLGLERMKKMGASYVSCSVEKENLPALKIYLGSGMKIEKNLHNRAKNKQNET